MTTYTKLKRTDEWGIRTDAPVKPGDKIEVQKKDGTVATEVIKAVLWNGNGISLCAILPKSTGGTGQRLGKCMNCGDRQAVMLAYDSSGIQGEVCGPCGRGPDYERSFA